MHASPKLRNKTLIDRLPPEILSMIFECYVRIDGPVSLLTQINQRWRCISITTQSLWRRLLLSADAIPPSLRAGSVHACGDKESAEQVLQRSGVGKLEVTMVLGPQAPTSPSPEKRAELFRTVNSNAFGRITFLCIIINPQMNLDLVTQSLKGVFNDPLPSLESMMIASAYAIGNLYHPLKPLLDMIDRSSFNLRSVYLENVNRDFILKSSTSQWWTRLTRLTIRNETDPVDASLFALCSQLEFLSFSGELAYGATNLNQSIDFPALQWLRLGVVSMGTLHRLKLPKLHSMVIHTVQGNYPNPAPPPHSLLLGELKIFHVATVNSTVACIDAPKLETLCLGIPTLKSSDADQILKTIFDGHEKMMKPKHLTLTAPVHDKHLINTLKLLPDLMSLQLDSQVPFSKTFFQAMTPPKSNRAKKPALCPKLRCLVLDVHKVHASMFQNQNEGDREGADDASSSGREGKVEGKPNWMRDSLMKIIERRKQTSGYEELLRLACKWEENAQNEELVQPTMCLSCIEVRAAATR